MAGALFFQLEPDSWFSFLPPPRTRTLDCEGLVSCFFSDYPAPLHRFPGELRISRRGTRIDRGSLSNLLFREKLGKELDLNIRQLDISINPIGFVESSLSSLFYPVTVTSSFPSLFRSRIRLAAPAFQAALSLLTYTAALSPLTVFSYHVLSSTSPPLVFSGPFYFSLCCAQLAPLIKFGCCPQA